MSTRSAALLFAWTACAPAPDPTDPPDRDTGVDETWPKPCSDIYDPDVVPELELDFDPGEWEGLVADGAQGVKQYRPVTFSYAGESVPAMVRSKGNWSWSPQKLQFVVSFNEVDPEARFHGQRKLILDAAWYDRTLMHERLAYGIFAARGLPSSCVNHAKVFVNGSYYGVYSNDERLDQGYLDRNFEEAGGDLYESWNERKTNEQKPDSGHMNTLKNAVTVDELAAVADLDQAVAEWAVEAMIPAMDNYWAGVEINYYLYDHPSRGFQWLPYDLDASFGDSVYPGEEPVFPGAVTMDPIYGEHTWWVKEPLVVTVLSDRYWCERFVDEVRAARGVYDPVALSAQVDAWDAQIGPAIAADPHKTFTDAEHAADVASLKGFLAARAAFVDGWLAEGEHCPATW